MLEKVLLWAIVLLLLVVLVPAGLALFQRIRAGELDRAAGVRRKSVPPSASAKIPPLQPSAAAAAPADVPAPEPPKTPRSDVTRLAPMPVAQPEGEGTEMVQWYGLILCTSGALEGQRFIIEDGGLYIGRDAVLSQVTIADKRISKRHVRIVPRDGKVMAIDQNSTNGTFLASNPGVRITDVELKRGDTIILSDGAATFVYQI